MANGYKPGLYNEFQANRDFIASLSPKWKVNSNRGTHSILTIGLHTHAHTDIHIHKLSTKCGQKNIMAQVGISSAIKLSRNAPLHLMLHFPQTREDLSLQRMPS